MAKSGVQLATGILDDFNEDSVKSIISLKPWMEGKEFLLLHKQKEIEAFIDKCIDNGICALDLETTGLNTRIDPSDGRTYAKIVGICISCHKDEGAYVPIAHDDKEYNVSLTFMLGEIKRLASNCRLIFHNFKYDGVVLSSYGVHIDDPDTFEDTLFMAAVQDPSKKQKGLKVLSERLLDRSMLEIDQMGVKTSSKDVVAFDMVPPQRAVYYGASDAMCTYYLYEVLKGMLDEQDPDKKSGPWIIYKIEKRCVYATIAMENNLTRIDVPYLEALRTDVVKRIEDTAQAIYEIVGRKFDISSPKQLGPILFEELKIPYPVKDRTASGQYITDEKVVLDKLAGSYPIVDLILAYRGLSKTLGTYIENLIRNVDENSEVKFQLNQVQAETGRYSASGGKGLKADGYCGVNCQNIPKYNPKDPTSVDLRRAIVARLGYKIVSIDYSGEELRIAANFSREPKWIQEFLHGTGDLHSITARIIYSKSKVDKQERATGKSLNFLTLYGGSAAGFARGAKIPYETAKKMLSNFFREYSALKSWIDQETKRTRRRGYSRTAFGRRRPLKRFYDSGDKKQIAFADRCAINSAVQGSGSDIIKIALYKVCRWIKDNGFEDDIRILLPVHDEIVFEIHEDKLDFYVPELCKMMTLKDVTKKLGWPIPLEVDAEYGDTFHVDHDYWEERRKEERPMDGGSYAGLSAPTDEPQDTGGEEVKKTNTQDVSTTVEQQTTAPAGLLTIGHAKIGAVNDSPQYHFSLTVREAISGTAERSEQVKQILRGVEVPADKESVPIEHLDFQDAQILDRIDKEGYLNYPMEIDYVTAHQLKAVLDILTSYGDKTFVGPKHKVRFVNREGEVWLKTTEPVSIDALVSLCVWLKI